MNEGVVEKIRAAGGEIYAVSSEPQYLADQAHSHWELNFDNVGDPHQEISKTCSDRKWLTLYANRGDLTFLQRGADWTVEHPKGYFQPGVLALTKEGRVLYRWRSIPSDANLNGTTARPTALHAWRQIEQSLAKDDEAPDAPLDDNPEIDQGPPPKLVFFAALIANGWFLKVKAFAYNPGVASVPKRFMAAYARWIIFFAFWYGALQLLPTLAVLGGFSAWLAWIVYDIRRAMRGLDVQVELSPD